MTMSPSASSRPTEARSCDDARFRVRHEDAIGELFGEVLALGAKAGLVQRSG
jgi:hypothetical protein